MGDRLRLLDARELKAERTASLILDMTGANRPHNAGSREWSERVLVMVESVLTAPSAIPVALAADAAILGIELGIVGWVRRSRSRTREDTGGERTQQPAASV